ncbi:RluA family pseudouridine synthase [Neorickettsia sennetsu]|uniref:Pseudouridine synthase n=1 Tax=Ehrlichia sennetsu (strain ATCC VR-367 / Miyayama) TaxID=222891 RepID=Q2GEQ1_EHRS3|nr:RluA family pseudouridine synthase [Neorickettsia sennetsu]ABD45649.1 ribosomal large subunit pseudouridine synthases, RluA family [Neorickettsia sennetsu str. Miyayama]
MYKCIVAECDAGNRLDVFLHRCLPFFSRSFIKHCIKGSRIESEGKIQLEPSRRVVVGEEYHLFDLPLERKPRHAFVQPLDVRYEDDCLLVIYKPAGLVVHPGIGNREQTLVNILEHHYPTEKLSSLDSSRPGIVHRLDKDTAGFLIVAKTNPAHLSLSQMIKEGVIRREYLALVHSVPASLSGEIKKPIKRGQRKMMIGRCSGKPALTYYGVIARTVDRKCSLVHCRLGSGRTHQIRLHMKSIGCPVVGDKLYGLNRDADLCAPHHALWAYSLQFRHPFTRKNMAFYIEPASIIQPFLEKISISRSLFVTFPEDRRTIRSAQSQSMLKIT